MKKIEALKRARDALLAAPTAYRAPETIAFIDEALAEQPSPPAWWPAVENILKEYGLQAIDFVADFKQALTEQPAQQQEPVAWMHPDGRIWTFGRGFDKSTFTIPLYTTPPHLKPLTDEEMRKLADKHLFYQPEGYEVSGVFTLARAIEAAHGIKENKK